MSARTTAALNRARARKTYDPDLQLAPRLSAYRAGAEVITATFAPDYDGESDLLRGARFLPSATCAHEALVVFETWSATTAADPRTGAPWASGAMAHYVQRLGRDGTVVDALVAVHAQRAAPLAIARVTFTPGVKGQGPTWGAFSQAVLDDGGAAQGDGGAIAALRDGFAQPDPGIADLVAAASRDGAHEVQRWVGVDRAAASLLRANGATSAQVVAGALDHARAQAIATYGDSEKAGTR